MQQYELIFFKHHIFWSNSMCMAATVVSFQTFLLLCHLMVRLREKTRKKASDGKRSSIIIMSPAMKVCSSHLRYFYDHSRHGACRKVWMRPTYPMGNGEFDFILINWRELKTRWKIHGNVLASVDDQLTSHLSVVDGVRAQRFGWNVVLLGSIRSGY